MAKSPDRQRPPYSGKYEAVSNVELPEHEAAEAEKQIAQAEAEFAAEISAAHAVKAAEQAEKDQIAALEAAKEKASDRLCPHCHAEMVKHSDADPIKAGAWHCNGCGACWAPGLKRMREGHPAPVGWAG